MIIKPLQRFGGEGVIKVSTKDQENLNSLINYYVKGYENYPEREPIMVQEFMEIVKQKGDIRILLLNGEILGAMKRKPQKGDFRTNVHAGATVFKHEVTDRQEEICRVIKNRLIKDGLYFVGIDVIGDYLTEINVTSPTGIQELERFDGVNIAEKIWQAIEEKVI